MTLVALLRSFLEKLKVAKYVLQCTRRFQYIKVISYANAIFMVVLLTKLLSLQVPSFSLRLLILRSYQSVSQTNSFSTVVILREGETYGPVRKNCKSKNSVSLLCIYLNVYCF